MRIDEKTVFRIDVFRVEPVNAEELMAAIVATNSVFDVLEGCIQNHVLRRTTQDGEVVICTIVEWRSLAAMKPAREAVIAKHQSMALDVPSMLKRLRVTMEPGVFETLDNLKV